MGTLDDIIKMVQQNNVLSKQMKFSAQLSRAVKPYEIWKQNFTGQYMLNEIAKTLKHQAIIKHYKSTQLGTLNYLTAIPPQFIPSSAFHAINFISKQHDLLFRNISGYLKLNPKFFQISSLQSALSDVSSKLATKVSINKQWNLLNEYEEITNEAVIINNKIITENQFTIESVNEIKNFLIDIGLKIDKIIDDANTDFWKGLLISVIFTILGIIVPNIVFKEDGITRQDVESILSKQFSIIESKLKAQNEYRKTNRVCKVMLKPKNKTLILATLPTNFDVIVLQINHNWIYASFVNPKDNLPQTGWILKKYLNIP